MEIHFPVYQHRLKNIDGLQIFDPIRKKFVALSPEEWVRQNFIQYLISEAGYPKALIRVESGLNYNQLSKRSDILVYDRQGQVFLLAECKNESIEIDENTLRQASVYNQIIRAKFLALTNGRQLLVYQADHLTRSYILMDALPGYD